MQGDNLQFLKTVYLNQDPLIKDKVKGKVKLIYNDPPFATKSDFQGSNGSKSYSDKIESAEFLENFRERLLFLRELLDSDGSIYVHMDWKKGHYIKALMDEIFGIENLLSEIIWKRTTAHFTAQGFAFIHDSIFWYKKQTNLSLISRT